MTVLDWGPASLTISKHFLLSLPTDYRSLQTSFPHSRSFKSSLWGTNSRTEGHWLTANSPVSFLMYV